MKNYSIQISQRCLSLDTILVHAKVPEHFYLFMQLFATGVARQHLVVVSGAGIYRIAQRIAKFLRHRARSLCTTTLSCVGSHRLWAIVSAFGDGFAAGVNGIQGFLCRGYLGTT